MFLQCVFFFYCCPRCVGCFISWSSLQAPLISLSAPEPFSHSKVPSTPSLSLQSSYAGDLTWEMGVEIVNRAIWLPFLGEKKTWDCNGKRKKRCMLMMRMYFSFTLSEPGFGLRCTWGDHECSSALPLKERLRMWFLNCSISSGFCCWICCANCCPLTERRQSSV